MATTVERPSEAPAIGMEQRFVLRGISWSTYEGLLADHADRRSPQFAYNRGELEIVAPSTEHERDNWALQRLVEAVADALATDFDNVGINTFKRPDLEVGFEPDAGFYLQNEPLIRDRPQIDLAVDPPPDLVVEIDVTHGSLDKLPLFAAMGIPEIWRCARQQVTFYVLEGSGYRLVETSRALSPLSCEAVNDFLARSRSLTRRAFRHAVQEWAHEQVGVGRADS